MKNPQKSRITKTDCKWYRGYIPCKPHKKTGCLCEDCNLYEPLKERILIIKLGAAGDVIRTTPLLRKLRSIYPHAEIVWLTYYPVFVPIKWVNKILSFNLKDITWLRAQEFSWLINLDKDDDAIALSSELKAQRKTGFGMDSFGKCKPLSTGSSTRKWLTGVWDDLNKAGTKNYMQEIFEICGFEFKGEEYILEKSVNQSWDNIEKRKTVIGLNTGCGARWTTRLWKDKHWIDLINGLKKLNFEVLLLGGSQEHKKNLLISTETSAKYPGFFELAEFIDLIDQCDVVVTQVTMALHIAIGLKRNVILLNNIFNKNEFYLYEKGLILQPGLDCLCCFKQRFDGRCPVSDCMDLIKPEFVLKKVKEIMDSNKKIKRP